ncbi:MAG: dihydroneopterin aldolase [Balneola sp.]
MDKLIIKGLRFHGLHGVYEEEKIIGNTFEVDLEFSFSLQEAAESDNLDKTIDYAKARSIVSAIMENNSLNLIETLCLKIGNQLFEEFKSERIKVKVRKMNPPMDGETEYSEVTMQWPR